MARLTPGQQQALAGAWFTIVGKGGGHGHHSHGHHHHHHHHHHQQQQQQDADAAEAAEAESAYEEYVDDYGDDMPDAASGAWYDRRRAEPWGRGLPAHLPYQPYAHYPYARYPHAQYPYAQYPYPYAQYPYAQYPYGAGLPPHHHHHHRHHMYQADVAPSPTPMAMPDVAPADDGSQEATPAPDDSSQAAPDQPTAAASGLVGSRYRIPPRNSLIQDPGPDRAGREVLPMSTGVAILPTQSAQITARPQRVAFRPERVFISAAGTAGGAADWVVNDIKIGNRSQFSQSGDVPGDMFATNAIDGFVSFETAQTAMDVVMVVTYIGLNESGVPFFASIVGTAAI
jgi:hypothetical protein